MNVTDLPTTFQSKIWLTESTEHWFWVGSWNAKGYGTVLYHGKTELAHRATYMCLVGPIPDGHHLHHDTRCKITNCVNPAHLQPATPLEHTWLDGTNIGAQYGARTHCDRGHALTPENVYVRSDGGRRCRVCNLAKGKRDYASMSTRQEYVDFLASGIYTLGDAAAHFGVSVSTIGKHIPTGTLPTGLSKADRFKAMTR